MKNPKTSLKSSVGASLIAGTVLLGASFMGGVAAGATLGTGSYKPITHSPLGAEGLFSSLYGATRMAQTGYCQYYGYEVYTTDDGTKCCYGYYYYYYGYCYYNSSGQNLGQHDGYLFGDKRERGADAGGFAGSGVSTEAPDYKNTFL